MNKPFPAWALPISYYRLLCWMGFWLIATATANAQYNIGLTYCYKSDLVAARYQPSQLRLDSNKKLQITAFNPYIWVGNNAISYGLLNEFFTRSVITDDMKRDYFEPIKGIKGIGAGADLLLLGAAYKPNPNSGLVLSFGFNVRTGVHFRFNRTLVELLLMGNKSMLNRWLDIGKGVTLSAYAMREYAFGAALPLIERPGGWGIKVGGQLKILQGIAAIYAQKLDAKLYTTEKQWLANFDYQVYTAGIVNQSPSPLSSSGFGAGVDIGLTAAYSNTVELTLSALDFGAVRYGKGLETYQRKGSVTYEGYTTGSLFGGPALSTDSLPALVRPDTVDGQAFTMPLPARLSLQAEFRLNTPNANTPDRSTSLILTYIQGFTNVAGASTRPFLAAGFRQSVNEWFQWSALTSYGAYNNFGIGAHVGTRLVRKTILVGVGSNNFLPLVFDASRSGFDVNANVSVAF